MSVANRRFVMARMTIANSLAAAEVDDTLVATQSTGIPARVFVGGQWRLAAPKVRIAGVDAGDDPFAALVRAEA